MFEYPSISGVAHAPLGSKCYAFYKYDGSNLRWEWSNKKGWHKFGTRNRRFDESDDQFGDAPDLFRNTIADDIEYRVRQAYKKYNLLRFTVFTEYLGDQSFAGLHKKDDPKRLILFDIKIQNDLSVLGPKEFIDICDGAAYAAPCIYEGNINKDFIQRVKDSDPTIFYLWDKPIVHEGVICKGRDKPWMIKIKTDAYRKLLEETYADRWKEYWE